VRGRLQVVEDPAGEVAQILAAAAHGGGDVVLTGGSTPADAYGRTAASHLADWRRTRVWFGDERCVAPKDPRSNFALADETLLSRLDPPPDVRRMEGERGPHEAAEAYERELREVFGDDPPAFDLLLLGIGPDGHCASLFPGSDALDERERWVVGVAEAGLEPFVPRVTLTLPALSAARAVVFLVTGEEKAEAVRRAFDEQAGPPGPGTPASLVAERAQERLTVVCDAAAASRL